MGTGQVSKSWHDFLSCQPLSTLEFQHGLKEVTLWSVGLFVAYSEPVGNAWKVLLWTFSVAI